MKGTVHLNVERETAIEAPAGSVHWLRDASSVLAFVVLCEAAGALGSLSMTTAPDRDAWYSSLVKPAWTPPSEVFTPVWIVLYALMGCAAGLVWLKEAAVDPERTSTLLFAAQLIANVAWSWVFFGYHRLGAAVLETGLLLALIGLWMLSAWRLSRTAAALILPYFAWVSFASALTYSIWRANS